MYKNPQLSDTARQLNASLQQFGIELPHAKCLEVLARMDGARTLHVAQARNNAGVRIADVAQAQAEAVMFESLGRYEGRLDSLLAELRSLRLMDDAREVDQLFGSIFRSGDGPVLSAGYGQLTAEEIPDAFDSLVERLKAVLVAKAKAPEVQEPSPLFEGPMLDWNLEQDPQDESLAEKIRQARYRVKVQRDGSQLYVDIAPAHQVPDELEGRAQLSLFIEVNQGLPCVHLSNDLYGDQVLTIFGAAEGLYLRPNDSQLSIRTGVLDAKEHPELAEIQRHETQPPFQRGLSSNHAFIVTKP